MDKDTSKKQNKTGIILRILLLLGCTAVIVALLPHADHQSYSYELNQPWKYPLLTADFDMPIMRDSTSARKMRDSIDVHFVPFVRRDAGIAMASIERLTRSLDSTASPAQRQLLAHLMHNVYSRGILPPDVYERVSKHSVRTVRLANDTTEEEENTVTSIDASEMLSPAKAFQIIDSLYSANPTGSQGLSPEMARSLSVCLQPDIVIDSVADNRYRSQEYLNVNGATGLIKKGQRIVDRGEIVNAQIYTNLNTYQEMLEQQSDGNISHTYYYIGQTVFILICFLALYLFLNLYRKSYYLSTRKMTFIMVFMTIFIIFSILIFEYIPNGLSLIPFAMVPVIIMVFFDARTANCVLIVTVLISALVATYPYQFIFLEMMAGLFATFSIRNLRRRSQLLVTALITFAVYVVGYLAFTLLTYGNFDDLTWRHVLFFAFNSVALSFTYVLIFLVEKLVGFTSTVTLVELSDINNKLLRRLSEEAPGTFQHSMQVSTLAAEAARAIGANTALVRTGALYHDIGKLESPIFFTENQHGVNPHDGLNPETSAARIIRHVTAGLALALKAKLPKVIRDFISEHHGKGVARYFYNTAVNESNGQPVDITKFQYPGPNPQTKETTILMMADCVEAASRSLQDFSTDSLNELVDRIINQQQADGLYKESNISFRDIEIVKDTFKKRLATIYHTRIVYPQINKEAEAAQEAAREAGADT